MAHAADRIAVITENLTDAGLDPKSIEECLKLLDEKKYTVLRKYLAEYRRELLDSVHKCNKQIDCLDYFTYQLKKSEELL